MDYKERGTVTRVDFKKKHTIHSKAGTKRNGLLTIPMGRVRLLDLFFPSLISSFLFWIGISINNSIISIFIITFAILNILLIIKSIVKKEIENIFFKIEDYEK